MINEPLFFGGRPAEPAGVSLIFDTGGTNTTLTERTIDLGNEDDNRSLIVVQSTFSSSGISYLPLYVNGVDVATTGMVVAANSNAHDDGHWARIIQVPIPFGRTATISGSRGTFAGFRAIKATVFGKNTVFSVYRPPTNDDGYNPFPNPLATSTLPVATATGGFTILSYVNNFNGFSSVTNVDFNVGVGDQRVFADYGTTSGTTEYKITSDKPILFIGASFQFS